METPEELSKKLDKLTKSELIELITTTKVKDNSHRTIIASELNQFLSKKSKLRCVEEKEVKNISSSKTALTKKLNKTTVSHGTVNLQLNQQFYKKTEKRASASKTAPAKQKSAGKINFNKIENNQTTINSELHQRNVKSASASRTTLAKRNTPTPRLEKAVQLVKNKSSDTTTKFTLDQVLPQKSGIQNVKRASSTKQNTPGLGIEYEVHIPAYFALLLNNNPAIEDFKLQSNVQDFGNLDDLLVDIKTKSGENLYFAFQLKHKEKFRKNLLPTNFEAKGDFNLEKYCEAFKNLSQEKKKYHFILYTNKNFDSSRTREVKKFTMSQNKSCLGKIFFNTSGNSKNLYKFEINEKINENVEVEDYRKFFSQFSLYTGQTNIEDLDKYRILDILKYKECYVKYIDFFRRWHRGEFVDKTLDKKTLNIHLLDIFLSPVTINCHFSNAQIENTNFFETLVQQFDITIIEDFKKNFIKELEEDCYKLSPDKTRLKIYMKKFQINSDDLEKCLLRLGKDSKIIDRSTKELKKETKLKLLYYFFQKPLIIDFNTTSQKLIYEAIKLFKFHENEIKLVLLGRNIDVTKFPHLRVFASLTAVGENLLEETLRRCNLSLQGRRNTSFEKIVTDEICKFVTTKEIFLMLKGNCLIGEQKEDLPECYIPRTVSVTVFDTETIIKHCTGAVLIFKHEDEFTKIEELVRKNKVKVMKLEDYLSKEVKKEESSKQRFNEIGRREENNNTEIPVIIILAEEVWSKQQFEEIHKKTTHCYNRANFPTVLLKTKECSENLFHEISQKARNYNVHLFKTVTKDNCLLIMSTKYVFSNENYKSTKISVEESKIYNIFNNSINILCAQPGMGKSTLMKYLKNECDPNFWTLTVDLKAYNNFFKENRKIDEILNYFLGLEKNEDSFVFNIKKMFLRNKKIVIFLDGLDEVEDECVDYIMNFTKQLGKMGFRIWLSSRQNLQQKIENSFNISAIEINELKENQQKEYIENRLKLLYNQKEIKEIIGIIINNTVLANNRQVLETPLQLQIITQIFIDDKTYYSNLTRNNFILTKMFEVFFEGKYKHYIAKIDSKNPHLLGRLEQRLENYEILALHSVLDKDHFNKLKIGNDSKFLSQIKTGQDHLGIITGVNSENKAVFEHFTFAEYFAAKFFVKNLHKLQILKTEIFSKKYQNLLLIFNIMLAENCPLHLSIIYRDLSEFRKLQKSSVDIDKGGRNILQVAACVGTRHPVLETSAVLFKDSYKKSIEECLVRDGQIKQFKGENSKMKEIIDNLLFVEPFKNDKLFGWNSLDYALAAGSLHVVEAVLEKFGRPSNFYEVLGKYYKDEIVAYYSIRFGYHRLLSSILSKNKRCEVKKIRSEYFLQNLIHETRESDLILQFTMLPDCASRTRIIELLVTEDINEVIDRKSENTFLHFAVLHKNMEVVKFLLKKSADVNIKNKYGESPLFLAACSKNLEIAKLLLDKGADVNTKTKLHITPLHVAVDIWNIELINLFLNNGANVNEKLYGQLLPHRAVENGDFNLTQKVIQKGANCDDKTFLDAIYGGNIQIIEFLLRRGVNLSEVAALHQAVRCNQVEVLKYLIKKGANVNLLDADGNTMLHAAARLADLEIIKIILNNSKTAHLLYVCNKEGATFLHLAVYFGRVEIVEFILEKGVDFEKIDVNNMEYPLYFAAREDRLEAKLLLEMTRVVKRMKNKHVYFLYRPIMVNYLESRHKEVEFELHDSCQDHLPFTISNINSTYYITSRFPSKP